ncbi:MAG TPA: putative porin, partial [Candidatus Eremiobacteraceae bacterium]|nr:putative porin [Candidatus Eremiobacteraceae bacterium]
MFGKRKDFAVLSVIAVLGVSLSGGSASGASKNGGDPPDAGKKPGVSAQPKPGEADNSAGGAAAHVEAELREVKELLRAQQQRIEALEEELRRTRRGASAPTPEPGATNTVTEATAPHDSLEKRLESAESRLKNVGPFGFSGDLRLRDEPFLGGPANQSQVRNRERFRLRFNASVKLNDDISGGFSLASGDLNDPISTNQTTNQ